MVKGFASDIENLIKRFTLIENYYPKLKCEEVGVEIWSLPSWLSQFTDKFNIDDLKQMTQQLREFEKEGGKLMEGGKSPRLP